MDEITFAELYLKLEKLDDNFEFETLDEIQKQILIKLINKKKVT